MRRDATHRLKDDGRRRIHEDQSAREEQASELPTLKKQKTQEGAEASTSLLREISSAFASPSSPPGSQVPSLPSPSTHLCTHRVHEAPRSLDTRFLRRGQRLVVLRQVHRHATTAQDGPVLTGEQQDTQHQVWKSIPRQLTFSERRHQRVKTDIP